MSDGNCVIGSKPHSADVGYVCEHHLERLARMLRDIEDEAIRLEVTPSMAIGYDTARSGTLASERSPLRIDAAAFLDSRSEPYELWPDETRYTPATPKAIGPWCLFCDHETCTAWRAGRRRDLHDDEHDAGSAEINSVLGELHYWAQNVRDARKISAPTTITVTGERDLLTRQLTWIAEQPKVADMYRALAKMLKQMQRINNTLILSVGRCDTLQHDGNLCQGKVWAVLIRPDGSIESGNRPPTADDEPGFRCATCRRVWTGTEAVRKRHQLWLDEQERKAAG